MTHETGFNADHSPLLAADSEIAEIDPLNPAVWHTLNGRPNPKADNDAHP